MRRKLVFSTNNPHKLEEVSHILGEKIHILSLEDIDCHTDIPETADTLEGNALLKARYVFDNYALDCFADDTGMEVEALNNEPGIFSARYAGENKDFRANMQKVLLLMKGATNRRARFRTVISLIIDGNDYIFEGVINGRITEEERGNTGFGYDPIFVPDGYDLTFAEMGEEIKNRISHRALAVEKLKEFLLSIGY